MWIGEVYEGVRELEQEKSATGVRPEAFNGRPACEIFPHVNFCYGEEGTTERVIDDDHLLFPNPGNRWGLIARKLEV